MILYTLYYYDRPFLEAFLNHYCHIPCIDEILIQNQNWSKVDTLYLLDTCAKYIDEYGLKIVVLPSTFQRVDLRTTRRAQFHALGQPRIRSRVAQFLLNETFITGTPDQAIYGKGYGDTNKKLLEFEEDAIQRAKEGLNTVGFMKIYTVTRNSFHQGIEPTVVSVSWKNRVAHFVEPWSYMGATVHDMQISVFKNGRWAPATPKSGHYIHSDFPEDHFRIGLKTLHYQNVFRGNNESIKFVPHSKKFFGNWGEHPRHYVEKLVTPD